MMNKNYKKDKFVLLWILVWYWYKKIVICWSLFNVFVLICRNLFMYIDRYSNFNVFLFISLVNKVKLVFVLN